MKAVYFERGADPSNPMPSYGDLPRPEPGEGELLVRVHATSIIPAELGWPTTWGNLGWGASYLSSHTGARVLRLGGGNGAGVRDLDIGEEVYGMNDWDSQGAQAEYCLTRPDQIARMPGSIGYVKAAAAPISALTAWQALVEYGHLAAGQRVLIHEAVSDLRPHRNLTTDLRKPALRLTDR